MPDEEEECDPRCTKFGAKRIKRIEKHLKDPYYVIAVDKRDFPEEPLPESDDPGTFTLYERSQTREEEDGKVVINLPAYIVNSHELKRSPLRDVSQIYDLQLKSPDNENLYVQDHHVLLQVMSQYVYYRKLCIWIKDELKKKRLELLEAARRALIDARDGEDICNCDPKKSQQPSRLLTEVEKQFLQKLVEGKTDMASLYVPRKVEPRISRRRIPKETTSLSSCITPSKPKPTNVPQYQPLPSKEEKKKKGGCCVIL